MPVEPATLNEYLRRSREDTRGSANELMQADIALRIKASQSLLSKVERGLARLDEWDGRRLYELLLAYRLTPAKMLQLADRYDLRKLKEYIAESLRDELDVAAQERGLNRSAAIREAISAWLDAQ